MSVVTIDYNACVRGENQNENIRQAFGPNGLGIVLVKNYPELGARRVNALNAIRKFATLPQKIKNIYARPDCNYSFGWSHGIEQLRPGYPDMAKGSYYADITRETDSVTDDLELKARYPESYSDNVWPSEAHCPGFEAAYKGMADVHRHVPILIARLLDSYLDSATHGLHKPNTLTNMLKTGSYKARLLHYFPQKASQISKCTDIDSFCGWHLDHGLVTTLVSPQYCDANGNIVQEPSMCGLYIKSPEGQNVKVSVPNDCIAVQIGELAQLFTGGLLVATPHCVKACQEPDMTRQQLAMFAGCNAAEPMIMPDFGLSLEEALLTKHLPKGRASLISRVSGAKCYRDFETATYSSFNSDKSL